jgi:gliding motility-associated-like protein
MEMRSRDAFVRIACCILAVTSLASPSATATTVALQIDEREPTGLPQPRFGLCHNGGFEFGNLAGWNGAAGRNTSSAGPVYANDLTPGIVAGRHQVVTPGADPRVSTLPRVPANGGSYAVRLGNSGLGAESESLEQTFVVSPAEATLYYRFALVLQDTGGHARGTNPWFRVTAFEPGSPQTPIAQRLIEADPSQDNFFDDTGGGLYLRRWSCGAIDLSQHIGKAITVRFETADCLYKGHFGYAYLDGLCETDFDKPLFDLPAQACPAQLAADGSATSGEIRHRWTVSQLGPAGQPVPGTPRETPVVEGEVGAFDLGGWYTDAGGTLECGKRYRVTLTIETECTGWVETSKEVEIVCPQTGPALDLDPTQCAGAPIIADGSATVGETAHFWSVETSDSKGGRPDPASEVSEWFQGEAGIFDLAAWLASRSGSFECGEYYRVKLAISTPCNGWQETVSLIRIQCPPVEAGENATLCCSGPQTVELGGPGTAGVTYSWAPTTGLDDATSPHPTLDLSAFGPSTVFPGTFTVTATDSMGCHSEDTVRIDTVCDCRPPAAVRVEILDRCHNRQRAIAECGCECSAQSVSYNWAPSGSSRPHLDLSVTEAREVTVTCSNACGATRSAPVVLAPLPPATGPFSPLHCPNVFTPNGDGINDTWVVDDLADANPAYNATGFRFEVKNRWGKTVARLSGRAPAGFTDRSIPNWDGRVTESTRCTFWQRFRGCRPTTAGQKLADGVYYYFLELENCSQEWTEVCNGFTHLFN